MFQVEDELIEDLDIMEIIEFGVPRTVYNRENPFETLSSLAFYKRFRLTKRTAMHVLTLVENELEFQNDLNNSVSPANQLLTALRFYASNSHLLNIADNMLMDESTVSRIIVKVSRALSRLLPQVVHLPRNEAEIRQHQQGFFDIARFPRIIGAVDGTHIRIQSPGGDDAEVFRNRKSYFSVNVQATCNSKLFLMDLVARWPGSTHDATIFNNSRIRAQFENGNFANSILLGDSGYPLRNYFLTPLLNPNGRAERLYNEAHIRTRNVIERFFGVWKRRFPVLAYGMRIKLETALNVITACGVLQNIATTMNDPAPPPAENIEEHELNQLIEAGQIPNIPYANDGEIINQMRTELINNYFAQL